MSLRFHPERKEEQVEQFKKEIDPRLRAVILSMEWFAYNEMGKQHLPALDITSNRVKIKDVYSPEDRERLRLHAIGVGACPHVKFSREDDGDKYLNVEMPPYSTDYGRFLFENKQDMEVGDGEQRKALG